MKTNVMAKEKVLEIERDVNEMAPLFTSISLMNGSGGLALFYYCLYEHYQEEVYLQRAEAVLSQMLDQVSSETGSLSYCDGLAGCAYLLNYLKNKEVLDESADEFLTECDEVLYEVLVRQTKQDNLDFLHGALGLALYFMQRFSSGKLKQETLSRVGDLLIQEINHTIHHGVSGNEFTSERDGEQNNRYLNLGMAHGLVAMMMFLVKYSQAIEEEAAKANACLRGVVDVILRFRASECSLSIFPSIVNLGRQVQEEEFNTPLGWCYGDTVISISLYHASRILGDRALFAEAEAIAIRSVRRNSRETALVMDACFCHGGAGIAYLYKKWYQYTGNPVFEEAYWYWIDKALELSSFADGVGGFKKYTGKTFSKEYGLLDGCLGLAMVLLDTQVDKVSDWDQFFLLS